MRTIYLLLLSFLLLLSCKSTHDSTTTEQDTFSSTFNLDSLWRVAHTRTSVSVADSSRIVYFNEAGIKVAEMTSWHSEQHNTDQRDSTSRVSSASARQQTRLRTISVHTRQTEPLPFRKKFRLFVLGVIAGFAFSAVCVWRFRRRTNP